MRKDSRTIKGKVPHLHWTTDPRFEVKYRMENHCLGKGATSVVRIATERVTGNKFAVKVVSIVGLSKIKLQKLLVEVEIMKTLDHPNVVRLLRVYESQSRLYLVMELCTGGELYDALADRGNYTEFKAAELVRMMLSAIQYCHSKGIVHRDLKLENFVFEAKGSSRLKLIDFGLSTHCSRESSHSIDGPKPVDRPGSASKISQSPRSSSMTVSRMNTLVGTVYYVAPEMFKGSYDEKVDVWSIGVITYMLLTGKPPYDGERFTDMVDLTKQKVSFASEDRHVTKSARHFIYQLLQRDPRLRATAQQALQLPWISSKINRKDSNVRIPTAVVESLAHFATLSALKRTAFMLLAQHVLGKELKQLRQLFEHLDKDNTGRLSVEELKRGLQEAGLLQTQVPSTAAAASTDNVTVSVAAEPKPKPKSKLGAGVVTLEDLDSIFQSLDQDHTGRIQFTQFLAAMISMKSLSDEEVSELFRRLDKDGSGHITISDIQSVLGKEFTSSEVTEIVEEADLDGDGSVSMDEFVRMMRGTRPRKPSTAAAASERHVAPVGSAQPSGGHVAPSTGAQTKSSASQLAAVTAAAQ